MPDAALRPSGRRITFEVLLEAQNNRANGVNLTVALITTWNTVYLDRALGAMQEEGQEIQEQLLVHLSPSGWD